MENFGSSTVGSTRSNKKNKKKQGVSAECLVGEEGVWLSASKLQEILSALPPSSPLYTNQENSDTSSSDSFQFEKQNVRKSMSHTQSTLPPIGVFWDIENCQVPNGVSALSVVQLIRDTFFTGYTEKEFVVVCDVTKENSQIIQELNGAQIDLVHVASICKNAADEKLRQALRRFAERYGSPSAVILVSSDINFAADLSDLRHRKKIHVILLHQPNASEALTVFSNEHYDYLELTRHLPHRALGKGVVPTPQQMDIEVKNLPVDATQAKIKGRLRLLSANCGGRVISQNNTKAVLRFSSEEFAYRASVRMDGEDVFGSKISMGTPQPVRVTPNSDFSRLASPLPVTPSYQYNRMPPTSPWSGVRGASFPVQPPNQWFPTSSETLASQYPQQLTSPFQPQKQSSFQSVTQSRTMQTTYQQQGGETASLSSVSSWFHPGLLPPPQISVLPQQPPMMLPVTMNRKARSPSPNFYSGSPFPVRPDADGSESFQPIHTPLDPQSVSSPVDLQVSNLDHGLDPKEMRRRLIAAFKEHVMVLQLSVYTQADGQMSARVRVASRQDAQVAVATLQRQVVGNRRIRISVANQGNRAGSVSPCAQLVRAQVAALLKEVPSHRLPLFQLCELYEKRFLSTVSLSELNRMRDLVSIMEEAGSGRMITLLPESRRSITPSFSDMAYAALQEGHMPELPYCPIHALGENAGAGWAEKTLQPLPNVVMSLPALSKGLYSLLHSHQGALPLYSLPLCYEAEVRQLRVDEKGVPLEHLVTWVPGVVLKSSPNGGCAKMLTWGSHTGSNGSHPPSSSTSEDSNNCCDERATSPAQLAAQVTLFGREVVELLRASPRCQISFIKFIPAYHHHFGRQCRVANYGYTRLIELLEALPNVVQVIGEGDSRLVVLAQPAQIRRFTSDLLRVLKTQPNKQAYLVELPELFTKCLSHNFDATEYGLCDIADLVSRVPKNTVVLSPPLGEDTSPQQSTILALPKREQTPDEMERTRHFALELVSLLRDAPQCAIPFNKFIPAYHHHFGHQCRLADYGVTKLAELLTAVSDVAQVEECPGGERRIVLSLPERQRVLGEQVSALVAATPGGTLLLSQLSMAYQRQHGVALDPPTYGAATTFELVQRLSNWVSVVASDRGPVLHPVNIQHCLSLRLLALLANVPNHRLSLSQLLRQLETKFQQRVNQGDLKLLQHMVQLSRGDVALTPLYAVAARIRAVLLKQGGSCLLSSLLSLYMVYWGFPLNPAEFNHTSLVNLLSELSEIFQLTGKGKKRTVVLAETQQTQGSSNASSAPVPIPSIPMVQSQLFPKTADRDTATGSNGQEKVLWGHILPNPAIQPPLPPQQTTETAANATSAAWDNKSLSSPWIGQPWGLQTQQSIAKNMWSESTPIKLWSPPKNMGVVMAPDPSELPMPSGSLLEHMATQDNEEQSTTLDSTPNKLSDSGIGQPSPTSPQAVRRPNRLAANFSSPIELL